MADSAIKIPEGLFLPLTKLQDLDISKNFLVDLSPGIFKNLKSLIKLDMSNNNLSTLDVDIFSDLKALQELILSQNNFQNLPSGILRNNINLEAFELENNPTVIQDFPTDLFHNLKKLRTISLRSAGINFEETDKQEVLESRALMFKDQGKSLEELILSNNNLNKMPDTIFKSLKRLSKLKLNHCNLTILTA